MKTRFFAILAAILLCSGSIAQTDESGNESSFALGNFDHKVTQPSPGGDTSDGGPQAISRITSVAGVPLVRLNNGVMMPRFGFGTQIQSIEGAGQTATT